MLKPQFAGMLAWLRIRRRVCDWDGAHGGLAAPVDEAEAAYGRGDFETALNIARPLAEKGDARAQCLLGIAYGAGNGAPQDFAEAVERFRLAEEGKCARREQSRSCMRHAMGVKSVITFPALNTASLPTGLRAGTAQLSLYV